jgi:hypothetical protein
VRMRRDIHWRAFVEGERAEPIEKAPRTDQASSSQRQCALYSNRADRDLANRVRLELLLNSTNSRACFRGYLRHHFLLGRLRRPVTVPERQIAT